MNNLIKSLIKFQKNVPPIPKNKVNPFFSQGGKKSMYADLASIIDICKPVLNDNDLAVIQMFKSVDGGNALVTKIYHSSGEFEDSTIMLPAIPDTQKLTAAITYLRRSAYISILGLVADDDDDGNSVSQPQKQNSTQMPQEPKQQSGAPLASDAQKRAMKNMGISFSDNVTKSEASRLIEEHNKKR